VSVRTSQAAVRTELLSARLYARVTEEELAAWRARASACKMIFSDWVRTKLNEATVNQQQPSPVAPIEDHKDYMHRNIVTHDPRCSCARCKPPKTK